MEAICTIIFLALAALSCWGAAKGSPATKRRCNAWHSEPRTYHTGPRGGRYYVNSNGNRQYK